MFLKEHTDVRRKLEGKLLPQLGLKTAEAPAAPASTAPVPGPAPAAAPAAPNGLKPAATPAKPQPAMVAGSRR
jgi:hypothetical protein